MLCCFFLFVWRRSGAPNEKEKRDCVGWRLTQGGGLGGLALGYYQAAHFGALERRTAAALDGGSWDKFCRLGILEGCNSCATPAGSTGDLGLRSGGIDASLNPRLLSDKPPACQTQWLRGGLTAAASFGSDGGTLLVARGYRPEIVSSFSLLLGARTASQRLPPTTGTPLGFEGPGDSRLPGFVVPDLPPS